jgi:cell wall-associated NlpC family hydrolase
VFPVSYKNRKWITESPKEPSGDIYAGLPDGNYNINPIRTPGVTPNLPASTAAAFAWAESQIGAPYAAVADYRDGDPPWPSNGAGAGATIKGFRGDAYTFSPGTLVYDCSGFVIAVYKKKGIDFVTKYQIWRSDQFNNPSLQDVEEADLQPLDIIVYKPSATNVGHVVMFHSRNSDGTINVIEATAKNGVTIGPLKPERVIARKRVDA